MSSAIAERTMARRNDVPVKIDADLARDAKIVASYKDISLAEYVTESLRPIVARDLEDNARRTLNRSVSSDSESKPKGKGPKS